MASVSQQPEVKPDSGFVSEEQRRLTAQKHAGRERQKQALILQRENILSQKTSSPARRSALEAALAHIESQIESLE